MDDPAFSAERHQRIADIGRAHIGADQQTEAFAGQAIAEKAVTEAQHARTAGLAHGAADLVDQMDRDGGRSRAEGQFYLAGSAFEVRAAAEAVLFGLGQPLGLVAPRRVGPQTQADRAGVEPGQGVFGIDLHRDAVAADAIAQADFADGGFHRLNEGWGLARDRRRREQEKRSSGQMAGQSTGLS